MSNSENDCSDAEYENTRGKMHCKIPFPSKTTKSIPATEVSSDIKPVVSEKKPEAFEKKSEKIVIPDRSVKKGLVDEGPKTIPSPAKDVKESKKGKKDVSKEVKKPEDLHLLQLSRPNPRRLLDLWEEKNTTLPPLLKTRLKSAIEEECLLKSLSPKQTKEYFDSVAKGEKEPKKFQKEREKIRVKIQKSDANAVMRSIKQPKDSALENIVDKPKKKKRCSIL